MTTGRRDPLPCTAADIHQARDDIRELAGKNSDITEAVWACTALERCPSLYIRI